MSYAVAEFNELRVVTPSATTAYCHTCKKAIAVLPWSIGGKDYCNDCKAQAFGSGHYRKPVTRQEPRQAVAVVEGSLPFRPTSTMRYCFEKVLKGAQVEPLREEVESRGSDFNLQLKVLLSGGGCNYCRTHTWTVQRDGSWIRVSNVQPVN
jgi:hypothetical protein